MTADRAKISYDPTRQYRSVIAQQGRVTLEADTNEAATIASEALRLETIDVMGPTGTPDNGYALVSVPVFSISAAGAWSSTRRSICRNSRTGSTSLRRRSRPATCWWRCC